MSRFTTKNFEAIKALRMKADAKASDLMQNGNFVEDSGYMVLCDADMRQVAKLQKASNALFQIQTQMENN